MKELFKKLLIRVRADDLFIEAAALSYTTILALVPALTVVISIFAMVPAFTPIKQALQNFVQNNFMPVFFYSIGDYIGIFIAHAGQMTVTGTVILFIVSFFLVRAVDRALNRIWRGGKRKMTMTFAVYWTLLTLGPLATGILIWFTSKVIAYSFLDTPLSFATGLAYFLVPVVVELILVSALFITVPVAVVKIRDAVRGALFVTILFEVCKRIFSAFILNFSDYEAIYGALAAIPVLMIWININWVIVLFGAEFTVFLNEYRQENKQGSEDNQQVELE